MISFETVKHAVNDEQARELWHRKSSVESFLAEMRSRGAFQIESIRAVRLCAGVSLSEAKEIVHYSHTWADMRASSEELHDTAWEALEVLQQEEAASAETAFR